MEINKIYHGNCLEVLKDFENNSINCCITSPPYYGLRDYGVEGQLGNEDTPVEYVNKLVNIFSEVKRVLKDDGTLWINIGDSYSVSGKGSARYPDSIKGSKQATNKGTVNVPKMKIGYVGGDIKPKDLIGIPWMLAFALRADGWYLRQDIIWAKGNPMPESVKDRCTKSHEYIFLMTKSRKYYFDNVSIKEPCVSKQPAGNKKNMNQGRIGKEGWSFNPENSIPKEGRNKRDVWTVNTKPCKEAHFATFPDTLIEPCVLAGCPEAGIILDPFMGSGTTGMVAKRYNRNYVGIELNSEYIEIAENRIKNSNKRLSSSVELR